MKLLASILFFLISGAAADITCKVGTGASVTDVSTCGACYTTTLAGVSTYGCTASGVACTPDASGSTICCTTNNCNAPGNGGGSGGGLTCYSDLTGKSSATMSNCIYCMRQASNFLVTSNVIQTCVPICVALDVGITKTTCCQTNLCNGAYKIGVAMGLILPLLLSAFTLFV